MEGGQEELSLGEVTGWIEDEKGVWSTNGLDRRVSGAARKQVVPAICEHVLDECGICDEDEITRSKSQNSTSEDATVPITLLLQEPVGTS